MVIKFADQIVCGESPVTCHNTTDRSDKCKSSVILKFTRGSGRIIVYDSGNGTGCPQEHCQVYVYSTKFCWPEFKTGWVTMWKKLVLHSLGSYGGVLVITHTSPFYDHCGWAESK